MDRPAGVSRCRDHWSPSTADSTRRPVAPAVVTEPVRPGPWRFSRPMANRTRSRRARHRTMPPRTLSPAERSLLDAIAEGELDDHLGAIASAVDARRRLLHTIESSHRLATLCVGDRVRIGQRVSPRYLAGLDGTIVEFDDHAATVRLDDAVGLRDRPRALSAAGSGEATACV